MCCNYLCPVRVTAEKKPASVSKRQCVFRKNKPPHFHFSSRASIASRWRNTGIPATRRVRTHFHPKSTTIPGYRQRFFKNHGIVNNYLETLISPSQSLSWKGKGRWTCWARETGQTPRCHFSAVLAGMVRVKMTLTPVPE